MIRTLDMAKTLTVKMNYIATEAHRICLYNPKFVLSKDQCFAIGFVSGAPLKVKINPEEPYKVVFTLDNVSVGWDAENEKFLIAVLEK